MAKTNDKQKEGKKKHKVYKDFWGEAPMQPLWDIYALYMKVKNTQRSNYIDNKYKELYK